MGDKKTKIAAVMVTEEDFQDLTRLAALNTINKKGPSNNSALVREAIKNLMDSVGYTPGETDLRAAPSNNTREVLNSLYNKSSATNTVRKTFSLATEEYEKAEEFTSYNQLHRLPLKNISRLIRAALYLYFKGKVKLDE